YIIFLTDTPTTEIYTLSLHDALPISKLAHGHVKGNARARGMLVEDEREHTAVKRPILVRSAGSAFAQACLTAPWTRIGNHRGERSEEHTSELQSRGHLVCRLLLEKKK